MPRKNYDHEMFAEPDPSSANTSPEFDAEMFEFYKFEGWKPEDIADLKERKKYESGWISKQRMMLRQMARESGSQLKVQPE
jgi:hypothetical protein